MTDLVNIMTVCVALIYHPHNRTTDILGVYENYELASVRVRELRECFAIPSPSIVTLHLQEVWGRKE